MKKYAGEKNMRMKKYAHEEVEDIEGAVLTFPQGSKRCDNFARVSTSPASFRLRK